LTAVNLQDWRRAAAACDWAIVVTLIAFFLTYFNEFRYIKIKPEVFIRQRWMSG